ncbi:MAG: N-acetyltransferase [Saprospiraceae bacterium]|jgi:predicted N-acetyltransferase YhbS
MKITIRVENPEDHAAVFQVVEEAFKTMEFSDHDEQFLVERLRKSPAFVPELSLVAEYDHEVIGHILLTRITIKNGDQVFESLALAPVSVKPAFQRKGVGGKLILEAHKRAKALGFQSIILLGHADYYPRFGYEPTSKYGIKLPFEVPEEHCMVLALTENGLDGVHGMVEYPEAFFL